MNVNELRTQLAIRCKNGLSFLLAATIVWSMVLVIFLLPYEIASKNILTLFSTGITFPLAILISKVINADWKVNDNPLGMLGLYINLAQLIYFPILFFAFVKAPNQFIIFFGVITGAHLFPYAWFYNTKAYAIMAPIISVIVIIIGWDIDISRLWLIPLSMILLLIILNIWLYIEHKVHLRFLNQNNKI